MLTISRSSVQNTILAAAVLGLSILAPASYAQKMPADSDARQASQSPEDAEVATRVKQALHSDPYFYDKHVDVVMDKGNVILKGFVFSDWDLRNAIRIATQAAGNRKVVDNLTIKEGGRQ